MNDMKEALEKAGVKNVYTEVSVTNDDAMSLLLKLVGHGYRPVFSNVIGRIDFVDTAGEYSRHQIVLSSRGTWSIRTSVEL